MNRTLTQLFPSKQGQVVDYAELQNYRLWQKGGEIAAGTILGMSSGDSVSI